MLLFQHILVIPSLICILQPGKPLYPPRSMKVHFDLGSHRTTAVVPMIHSTTKTQTCTLDRPVLANTITIELIGNGFHLIIYSTVRYPD